ncbi:MAG TPA: hypothetical protein VFE91_06115, partial [Nitrososphaerales archaeon]|nr:hypothetical protein [Nitrososphaerales archaeon]
MPEIWIPFGGVETLVTLQAENLGSVESPDAERISVDTERISSKVKDAARLFICDSAPATFELIKELLPTMQASNLKVFSAAPRKVETAVTDLRGKVITLPPPVAGADSPGFIFAPDLKEPGGKVFVGTAHPDPLFGVVDSKVQACLNWVAGSRAVAAKERSGMEPSPFAKTEAYDSMESAAGEISEASFLSLLQRGGRLRTVMEDAPFDALKNGFHEAPMSPSKGLIVGSGGAAYDDTFSSALRGIWGALPAVRRSGSILMVSECTEGLGSPALELLATGRLTGEGGKRREKYVEGIEEVFYLSKLKDEYEVLLLSGLPET